MKQKKKQYFQETGRYAEEMTKSLTAKCPIRLDSPPTISGPLSSVLSAIPEMEGSFKV